MQLRFHKLLILASVFLLSVFFTYNIQACSCAPAPPPCEAIGWSELVFLGTVTEVSQKTGDFKRVQMHIDHVYKGTLKEMIELFDNGMCDGPDLEIGRQYLMYTTALSPAAIPA